MKPLYSIFAFLLLFCSTAHAQLSLTLDEVEPYEPISAELAIPQTTDKIDIQTTWRTSSEKVKYFIERDGSLCYIWAPPGRHWVEVTVVAQTFKEMKVRLVVDDNDPSKDKVEIVKVALSLSVNTYQEAFTVKGAPAPLPLPGPDPAPAPTPGPAPAPLPSAQLQGIMAPLRMLVAAGDATKASKATQAWQDLLHVVSTGQTPKTTGELKSITAAFLDAYTQRAGLVQAFPGFSVELEKAHNTFFGTEDKAIDQLAVKEFVAGVVWACTR